MKIAYSVFGRNEYDIAILQSVKNAYAIWKNIMSSAPFFFRRPPFRIQKISQNKPNHIMLMLQCAKKDLFETRISRYFSLEIFTTHMPRAQRSTSRKFYA